MGKTTSNKSSFKASESKLLVKPPPVDKTLGVEPEMRLYTLEDCDETAELDESEILFIHDSNLVVSKKNLVKRNFPYIDKIDHEGPAVFNTMYDLTS